MKDKPIRISETTRDRLKKLGQKGESYDTVIQILLFVYKQHSEIYTDDDFDDQIRLNMERRALL